MVQFYLWSIFYAGPHNWQNNIDAAWHYELIPNVHCDTHHIIYLKSRVELGTET